MTTTTARRTPVELAVLHGLGTPTAVRIGCALAAEGTPGRDAFLIVDGTARVTKNGLLVGQLGPGDFVGELALIDHGLRCASVTAASAMQVIAFDARSFAALLDEPSVSRELQRQLVARLRAVLESISTTQPSPQQESQS